MFTTISYALGLTLTITVFVLIARKLITGDVDNDGYKGAIIPVVVILSLVSLFCSVIAVAGALILDLKYMSMSSTEITQVKNHNIIALVVGYGLLLFNYVMLRIIEIKGKKNEKEKHKYESRWDLDKIDKSGSQ